MVKKRLFIFLFVFLFLIGDVSAANWYVKSNGGVGAGTDWNNAFNMTTLNSNWASIQPGDTIWLAGGYYTTGMRITASGTPTNWIYIKRALATDSVPTSAAGWQSSFDSQVYINLTGMAGFDFPGAGTGNYVSVDGRTGRDGISVKYDNSAGIGGNKGTGGIAFSGTGAHHDILFNHVELAGPGGPTQYTYNIDHGVINFWPNTNDIYNFKITNCIARGGPNIVYSAVSGGNERYNITIDRCTLKDSVASICGTCIHDNLIYTVGGEHHWTISNNDISNWQSEGIDLFDIGSNSPWYIYGNVFRNPRTSGSSLFWPGSNNANLPPQGPVYFYNNVLINVPSITNGQGRETDFAAGSIARNNIYWNSGWAGNSIDDRGYEYSNQNNVPGTGSIVNTANPFVNSAAGNYNISSTSPVRNTGIALTNIYNQSFNIDANGDIRGADGAWDIGAYEFSAPAVCINCRYVRQGATGTNNGSDWTNAYTTLPATLTRGYTYYIADGTYSGYTFDDAASGSQYITIKKATTSDHGTDTGWVSTYGDGQATWTGGIDFTTSNWVFNGSVGSMSKNPLDYGFTFNSMQYPIGVGANSVNTANVVISHIAANAPSGDVEKFFVGTGNQFGQVDNVTISHNYLNGWQAGYWATSPLQAPNYQDNWIFEFNIALNGFSSSDHHGEWINNNYGPMNNQITRYNLFEGHAGSNTCMTGIIVANNNDNINAKVYGNVFNRTWGCNGLITGTSAGDLVNASIHHNTFVNNRMAYSNPIINGPGSGSAYNNIFYSNTHDETGNYGSGISTLSHDYNWFYPSTNTPSETNKQTGTASPFVSQATGNFRLIAATNPGLSLNVIYNTDMDGVIRGADGVWDRGAYEYSSGGSPVQQAKKQVILIGVDGVQVAHLNQMIADGKLPNFARLSSNGGFSGNATITGHTTTETAPGNSELHTGLPASVTGVSNNNCGVAIPAGLTTYERLLSYNSNISLGLLYGKTTCYIPDAILMNAKPIIPFWHNRTSYSQQTQYVSANYADSRNVSTKSFEFLNSNKNNSFYFVVYYGTPDGAGHTFGENSLQYNDSLVNVDLALGMLLDYISQNNMNVQIILSADHGWNEGTTGHGTNAYDTVTIPLFSNNASLVNKIYAQGLRRQCDIAPTILNYFGMNSSQYSDITSNGCGSLISNLPLVNGVCSSTLNACNAGTLNDIADNSTSYLWQCTGSNGGSTASCSQVIPVAPNVGNGSVISVNAFGAYVFNLTQAGTYKLVANVSSPGDTGGSMNSLYIDIDTNPGTTTGSTDDMKSFDFDFPLATFTSQDVSWRGNNYLTCFYNNCSMFNPKNWTLNAGLHTLYVGQRESAISQIASFKLIRIDGGAVVDTFNYHPADNNPQNKVISSLETSAYMNSYFVGSVSLTEALYALTLTQSGGSYRNLSSSSCNTSPWNCWASN